MINYLQEPKWLAPLPDEVADNSDFTVLTNRNTVKNFAVTICNELRHPVTIIDINRVNNNEDPCKFRIDSDISHFAMRGSCRLFRHCAGADKCYKCDEFHAKFFKESVQKDTLEENINDMKKQIEVDLHKMHSFFYDEYKINPPKVYERPKFNRVVVEYYCPILGYRELLFPIYYNKKVIAVLFIGQTMVRESGGKKTDNEIRLKIASDFFEKNKPSDLFKGFLLDNNILKNPGNLDIEAGKIRDLILKADDLDEPINKYLRIKKEVNDNNSGRPERMVFNDIGEYDKFIEDACNQLKDIEEKLKDGVLEKQKKLFKHMITEAVNNYHSGFEERIKKNKPQEKREEHKIELKTAWDLFLQFSIEINNQFAFKEVLLFGDGMRLEAEENKSKSLYPTPGENDNRNDWRYDFSIANNKNDDKFDYLSSLNHPDILDGLFINSEIDRNSIILIVCHDIAVLLHVENVKKNNELYGKMIDILGEYVTHIRSYIALYAANYMKEHHILTLRMNRHEGAHISTLVGDHMRMYFESGGQNFINLSFDKRKLISADIKNAVHLISYMSDSIGLITGSIKDAFVKSNESTIDVFNLLYKWRIMFRAKLRGRNLDIIVIRRSLENLPYFVHDNSEEAPSYIKSYHPLFDLLIYNLVDNAVKYAHRGSIIYLSWLKSSDKSCYELKVSSFGPEIQAGENIFDLYVRGNSPDLTLVDGDGIGLYVVSRSRKLLGFNKVYFTCVPIEERYHLPLVDWYIKEKFIDAESKNLQTELQKFKEERTDINWTDILNDGLRTRIERVTDIPREELTRYIDRKKDLTKEYLNKRINRGTWLTTFTITVPKSMV
ncbi:MAG: hypothetical protein FWE82_03715 [Defluviitaleaceae bacterium]|nr:hypothetical protein [Defluviitaleaceae bacterium]